MSIGIGVLCDYNRKNARCQYDEQEVSGNDRCVGEQYQQSHFDEWPNGLAATLGKTVKNPPAFVSRSLSETS